MIKLFFKGAVLEDAGARGRVLCVADINGLGPGAVLHIVLKPSKKHAWVPLGAQREPPPAAGGSGSGSDAEEDEGGEDKEEGSGGKQQVGPAGQRRSRSTAAGLFGATAAGGGAPAAGPAAAGSKVGGGGGAVSLQASLEVPWADLQLEDRPFARGGGGQVGNGLRLG